MNVTTVFTTTNIDRIRYLVFESKNDLILEGKYSYNYWWTFLNQQRISYWSLFYVDNWIKTCQYDFSSFYIFVTILIV